MAQENNRRQIAVRVARQMKVTKKVLKWVTSYALVSSVRFGWSQTETAASTSL